IVRKLFWIGFSHGRVFVVAMGLAGDNFPLAVALQPGVSDVIPGFQVLAEDRLSLVSVVAEYGCAADNPALRFLDLNRTGITCRHRRDVGDQFWFVENAAFLVSEDAVVGEVFFPRRLIAWNDGVVKLLSATDQFVLRNWTIGRVDESYGGEKCNERRLHNKQCWRYCRPYSTGLVYGDSPTALFRRRGGRRKLFPRSRQGSRRSTFA